MPEIHPLLLALLTLCLLVGCGLILRGAGILQTEHSGTFNGLFMNLVLPSMIFSVLARQPFDPHSLVGAGVILAGVLVCMAVAWAVARLLGLDRPQTGSFMMVTAFGSSTTLGISFVDETLRGEAGSMETAVVVAEAGVMIPALTLGIVVAMWFGSGGGTGAGFKSELGTFLKSPVFLSIMAGLVVGSTALHETFAPLAFVVQVADQIGKSLTLFVALSISLMLAPVRLGLIWKTVAAACLLKLILEPLLVMAGAAWFDPGAMQKEILLIEAAMPASSVAAILAVRYGCEPKLASTLVIAQYFIGLFTVPLLFYFLI